MENEKAMDKRGMTAEREMEILEAVAEKYGEERFLDHIEEAIRYLAESIRLYKTNRGVAAKMPRMREERRKEIRREAARMSVRLNVLSVLLGEPVEEEIAYLEELAEKVGADGR